jgi:CubicO group peptidase (beta-lactamase class C family)
MPNMVNLLLPFLPFLLPSALALECRPKGVIFPRPRNLEQSETFQNALDALTTTLDAAFNGDIRAGWDIRNVSLSMALVGLDQTESSTPLWEYHHLASGNVNGTKSLNKHSQYLIGSVSKVITDAILIRTGVNIDDPVIKYLPVLNNDTALIDWKNITLRALGGHLAGIAPNCKFPHLHG